MNKRIKQIRLELGLTQQEFADRIKVKRNTVATYEMGRSTPSDSVIALICKEFNVNEEWLRYGKGKPYRDKDMDFEAICSEINVKDEKAKVAIMKYYELSPEDKKLWWQFVERFLNLEPSQEMRQNDESSKTIHSEPEIETIVLTYAWNKASAGTGYLLFDDSPTENLRVVFNDVTRKADICIGVSGDSMEPEYYDGDILLVRKQPDINIGEIGIFMKGDKSYVKKKGRDGLVSLNPAYEDIQPSENEDIICYGKVLGKLEDSWRR